LVYQIKCSFWNLDRKLIVGSLAATTANIDILGGVQELKLVEMQFYETRAICPAPFFRTPIDPYHGGRSGEAPRNP
jgi:hypothetical protein